MRVSAVITEWHHTYHEAIAEAEQPAPGRFEDEREHSTIEADEMRRLLTTLEVRDGYSGEHSRAVMGLAAEVARQMGAPRGGGPRRRRRRPPARHRKGIYSRSRSEEAGPAR
jgi:hypothetical protein